MKRFRVITALLAVVALALLFVSGPGTKAGILDWRIGLILFGIGGLVGAVAAALALLHLLVPKWRRPTWVWVMVLGAGIAAFVPTGWGYMRAKSVPPIHDITTDVQDPPRFVDLYSVRKESPNGAEYGGPEVARQQRGFYPQVYPVVVKAPPAEALQKAIDAARASGWEVVSSNAVDGRIEATDTTWWFGFKDDIVIRVKAVEGGSRIDARSASRVGTSDIGANAARLEKFLAKLS